MTTGEGGAVTTNNADWADFMRLFRSHGLKGRNDHEELGYNYRMTEMAAAIGIVQLGKLEGFNDARIRNSERLIERLSDIPWLSMPQVPAHVRHTYFWCHALIDEDRLGLHTQELISRLREQGVEVRNRYIEPLYKQPLLTTNLPAALRLAAGDRLPAYAELELPNVERVAGRMIGLPNRPDMVEAEIDHIVSVLAGF
jgi:dTDP-4-amino-4,6-dideoxygalactose transaminase